MIYPIHTHSYCWQPLFKFLRMDECKIFKTISSTFRTVLRDLSRILTLLNRSEVKLGAPPPDWDTLLDWAERSLRRYKKSVGSEGAGSGCSSGATSSSASSTPTSSHALNQHAVSIEIVGNKHGWRCAKQCAVRSTNTYVVLSLR